MRDAKRITLGLRGHWHGHYGLCFCPAHANSHTPALSVSDSRNGKLLLRCHAGCRFSDILDALKGLGIVDGASDYSPPTAEDYEAIRQAEEEAAKRKEAKAVACWQETFPIHGTIAETYLCSRAITCPLPETLRFHPACHHPGNQRSPALVALVEGSPRVAIHRTYLRPDGQGKAVIEPAKAMLGSVSGGAVRLSGGSETLFVCEGIETGLSLLSGLVRGSVAVWAALSTSGMKNLCLPNDPGALVIATDGDTAGREAGHMLAARADALGWRVSLLAAPDAQDWNDVLMMKGAAA
ncbi:DUF7146 domain-containing protein [Brucella anthropi]|uniref:DUF7146 domain-containing protein n=1 Tax=Brucella anthropi TaxID=529 RepID=UPI00124C9CD7|nr:toprim domain-containing protein [Brucella anthropi]KAB2734778.1 hypothetical protein F9K89_20160 [Brucella anthropi]